MMLRASISKFRRKSANSVADEIRAKIPLNTVFESAQWATPGFSELREPGQGTARRPHFAGLQESKSDLQRDKEERKVRL